MKRNYVDFNPFFLKLLNLNNRIEFLFSNFNNIILSNSLSIEDIFILYFFDLKKIHLNNFFLNTGRIFNVHYNFFFKLNNCFFNKISLYYSNFFLVNKYIRKYSLNSFYNNIILRKICCYIRKIEPYNKIIFKKNVLLTGQRKNRFFFKKNLNYDFVRNIIKYDLLFSWDYKDIFYFTEKFNIPTNYFYNYGYSSIGCSPCTSKTLKTQHIRAGRWWWEKNYKKECGLHT